MPVRRIHTGWVTIFKDSRRSVVFTSAQRFGMPGIAAEFKRFRREDMPGNALVFKRSERVE